MKNPTDLKIGDVVYLTKPFEWFENDKYKKCIYPIGSPIKILSEMNFRGYNIEFLETGVKAMEVSPFNPRFRFSKTDPTKTDEEL